MKKNAELTATLKRYKENGALAVKRIKGLTAQKEEMDKEGQELRAKLAAAQETLRTVFPAASDLDDAAALQHSTARSI